MLAQWDLTLVSQLLWETVASLVASNAPSLIVPRMKPSVQPQRAYLGIVHSTQPLATLAVKLNMNVANVVPVIR